MKSSAVKNIGNYIYIPSQPESETAQIIEFPTDYQPAPRPETLSESWRQLKRNFAGLGERFRHSKAEMRAIGHLATLDIDKALESLQMPEAETKLEVIYTPPPLMERVRLKSERLMETKQRERRRKIHEIRQNAPWYMASVAASMLAGYLATKR